MTQIASLLVVATAFTRLVVCIKISTFYSRGGGEGDSVCAQGGRNRDGTFYKMKMPSQTVAIATNKCRHHQSSFIQN